MKISSFLESLLRHPYRCLFTLLSLVAVFAFGIPKVTVDTSIQSLISSSDPRKDIYVDYVNNFGSDRTTIILVEDETLWSSEKLEIFEEFHYEISDLSSVLKVESLINVSDVHDEDGEVASGALLDPIPSNQEEVDKAKFYARNNSLFDGQYITPDGKGLVIIVTTPSYVTGEVDDVAVNRELVTTIENFKQHFERITSIGGARLNSETNDVLIAEMPVMFSFLIFMLLGGMWLATKRPQAAFLPLITATISTLVTFGFLGLSGIPLNMLGGLAPVILLALGSTEDMHYFAAYMEGLRRADKSKPATDKAAKEFARKFMVRHVGIPTILTAITSTLGFAASAISDVPAIRDFGIMASFAIFANGFITILLAPTFFYFFGDKESLKKRKPLKVLRKISLALAKLFDRVYKKPLPYLVFFVVIFLGAVVSGFNVNVSNHALDALTDEHPFKVDYNFSEGRLGGLEGLTIVVDSRRSEQFRDPEALAAIFEVSREVESLPGVVKSTSLADQLAHINHVWGNPEVTPPTTKEEVAQFLLLLQFSDIESYVTRDFRYASIKVKHTISDTKELLLLINRIDSILNEHLPIWLKAEVTGESPLAAYTATGLISSQGQSIIFLILTIYVVMALIFSSFKAGLGAVLPNIFVPVFTLGFMGVVGLDINPPLVIVIVVSIGIAVDDTIHMLSSYKESCKKISNPRFAARYTIRQESAAVLTTTLALCIAFFSQMVSSLYYTQMFGFLMAVALIFALIIDIIFTPLLMTRLNFVGVFDLISQKIPVDNLKSFPLFSGMKPRYIRKIILSSVQRNYKKGDEIIKIGSSDKSLLVLLKGRAGIYLTDGNMKFRHIADMLEGDTVGEVSLLVDTPRSATIIADDDCWLIEIDIETLESLQITQPYLSGKLYQNIVRILSVRLLNANSEAGKK